MGDNPPPPPPPPPLPDYSRKWVGGGGLSHYFFS